MPDPTLRDLTSLLEQVRERFQSADLHGHFQGDMDRVNTAQVALDTAEDAMLALSNYESGGIGSDDGEKYLKLYGFFQAVFLQQDAIKELYRLFVGEFRKPVEASAWQQLRELRNLTIGHPIDKGQGKEPRRRTFITRVSLKTDGFDYQVWHQETQETSFESANLSTLYTDYENEAACFVEMILARLSRVADT